MTRKPSGASGKSCFASLVEGLAAGLIGADRTDEDCERAEECRKSLSAYIREAWRVVEPETPLLWNWHIDAIAEHLEAQSRGEIQNLLINIPPGHMKSLIVSVFWPSWEWLQSPATRWLMSSYALELAIRDSVRCRDILESPWYRSLFRPEWSLSGDQNVKSFYRNTATGERLCISVGSRATGFRGNRIVCDDPLNASDAHSDAALDEAVRWWDKVMPTRLNDPRRDTRTMIMQRLHERDPSGHILSKDLGGGFVHLMLPTEFEPERKCFTKIGYEDPRTEAGELLFPELFTREVVDSLKRDLGSDAYAGQHQQRPAPAEGLILKRQFWRYWQPAGANLPPVRVDLGDQVIEVHAVELPERFDEEIQSWDMAFKDKDSSDPVAGQVWGRLRASAYLLDQDHGRKSFTESVKAVRAMSVKHPKASAKLIEDKANGPAVIDSLRTDVPGLIAVDPEGGKTARAHAVQPFCEAGNVFLPHPSLYSWVEPLIAECAGFPRAEHDDRVDALTQALIRLLVQRKPTVTARTVYTM